MGSMAFLAVLAIAALSIVGLTSGRKQASECRPCKKISSSNSLGPDWAGLYHLQETGDMRCEMDGCLYRKGDSLFCFAPGNEEILSCDSESPGENCDTVDVQTHTYGPVAPSATDLQVRCGVRREVAACLERVRIVGGDEAGCNEWPWQVGLLSRDGWAINSD